MISSATKNIVKGKVIDVQEGVVAEKVKVDIGGGNTIASTITVEAVKEHGTKVGDAVSALIKANNVMVGEE